MRRRPTRRRTVRRGMQPDTALDALPLLDADRSLLERWRFDAARFAAFQQAVRSGRLTPSSSIYRGSLEAPRAGDVAATDAADEDERARWQARGERMVARGEVAVVV